MHKVYSFIVKRVSDLSRYCTLLIGLLTNRRRKNVNAPDDGNYCIVMVPQGGDWFDDACHIMVRKR